jgi:hypothetical protein
LPSSMMFLSLSDKLSQIIRGILNRVNLSYPVNIIKKQRHIKIKK